MALNSYKTVVTITWEFTNKLSQAKAKKFAADNLAKILDDQPIGDNYERFNVQLDLVKLKKKKSPIKLAEYPYEEILSLLNTNEKSIQFKVKKKTYQVRLSSDRYDLFKKTNVCASCGITGNKFILMSNIDSIDRNICHLDLYGEESGRLVLMTKDHIIPKSKGGKNEESNYQCLCTYCNNLKSHFHLPLEALKELRELYRNKEKLPPGQLKKLIKKTREELQKKYEGT